LAGHVYIELATVVFCPKIRVQPTRARVKREGLSFHLDLGRIRETAKMSPSIGGGEGSHKPGPTYKTKTVTPKAANVEIFSMLIHFVDVGHAKRRQYESHMYDHVPHQLVIGDFLRGHKRFQQVNGRDGNNGCGHFLFE